MNNNHHNNRDITGVASNISGHSNPLWRLAVSDVGFYNSGPGKRGREGGYVRVEWSEREWRAGESQFTPQSGR